MARCGLLYATIVLSFLSPASFGAARFCGAIHSESDVTTSQESDCRAYHIGKAYRYPRGEGVETSASGVEESRRQSSTSKRPEKLWRVRAFVRGTSVYDMRRSERKVVS